MNPSVFESKLRILFKYVQRTFVRNPDPTTFPHVMAQGELEEYNIEEDLKRYEAIRERIKPMVVDGVVYINKLYNGSTLCSAMPSVILLIL